ncbi:hypothetical protein TNCV_1762861 [Trichonephila clavipes]|nr:hypothetical protein TNCV_1762861 [Trichonephila clavipes]
MNRLMPEQRFQIVAEWAQNEIAVVPHFHKRILFSDEAHFWLNGYVNKQTCRIWSEANPQGYVKSLVYLDKPQTLDRLEDNIRRVIADIRPQMLEKVIENWTSRLDYIGASRGSDMPEIIFKICEDSGKRENLQNVAMHMCQRKRISWRGIQILNRFPIILVTFLDNAGRLYFRHIMAEAYLKSLGTRKILILLILKLSMGWWGLKIPLAFQSPLGNCSPISHSYNNKIVLPRISPSQIISHPKSSSIFVVENSERQ